MGYESIAVSNAEGIARITLNRPDRLNSFTRAMHGELRDALANLADARVVILTGAGRGFCAGQDLNDRAVAPGEAAYPHPRLLAAAGYRTGKWRGRRRRREYRARLRPGLCRQVSQVHPELFGIGADP
jgi:enoyl-CoA hydratase/carnithine racemase